MLGRMKKLSAKVERCITYIAFRELETFAATRVRKQGSQTDRMTGNLVAAAFTHTSSRALDPLLHTHHKSAAANVSSRHLHPAQVCSSHNHFNAMSSVIGIEHLFSGEGDTVLRCDPFTFDQLPLVILNLAIALNLRIASGRIIQEAAGEH